MWALAVVKAEEAFQRRSGFRNRAVSVQVHLIVFDRFPQPLDEDVIPPAASAVHADFDVAALQNTDEGRAGELTSLIGVHDLGATILQKSFFQRVNAGVCRQAVG